MEIPQFGRAFFSSDDVASRIGGGALGGKGEGLVRIFGALRDRFGKTPVRDVDVGIPRMAVLATDVFDRFVAGLSLLRKEPLVQASGLVQPGPASF